MPRAPEDKVDATACLSSIWNRDFMNCMPDLRPILRSPSFARATTRQLGGVVWLALLACMGVLPVLSQQQAKEPVYINGDEGTMRRENGEDILELQGNVRFRHGTTTVESRRALQVGPRDAAQIFFYDEVM